MRVKYFGDSKGGVPALSYKDIVYVSNHRNVLTATRLVSQYDYYSCIRHVEINR